MKVLYVEDEDTTRLSIKQAIKTFGHEVKVASNGEEGFKAYQEFKPDLILSDIQMP